VINEGILNAIGNTPLVPLTNLFEGARFSVFAKIESLNPGGSIKDRAALSMLRHGIATGAIDEDTVIIESSSGNMGIGLAQICASLGLRFICVVDKKTTAQNIRILRAYGAETEMVDQPDEGGEFLGPRLNRVKSLLRLVPNSFWPNQYANLHNPLAHRQTMREIVEALHGRVDYLFCAVSTCGTLRGCAEYACDNGLQTTVVAVDAVGSIIFGGEKSKRLIPGHGASVRPALFKPGLVRDCIRVCDIDCVVGCRRLVRSEGILAGGSSGAVVMALEQCRDSIPAGRNCVVILPDRGERYLDTIYSDEWVSTHFGNVFELWEGRPKAQQLCAATA